MLIYEFSVLAPASRPLAQHVKTNSDSLKQIHDEEFEDELDIHQPSFSIAIDNDEADTYDFHSPPPLSELPEDGEQTGGSFEVARQTVGKEDLLRNSIRSLEKNRQGDRFGLISEHSDRYPRHSSSTSVIQPFSAEDVHEWNLYDQEFEIRFDTPPRNSNRVVLISFSNSSKDLRAVLPEISERRNSRLDNVQQAQSRVPVLPFVLDVPLKGSAHSTLGDGKSFQQSNDGLGVEALENLWRDADKKDADCISIFRPPTLKASMESCDVTSHSSLPYRVSRKVASSFLQESRSKHSSISNGVLKALAEAGDQYLKQLGEDLNVWSSHARRKKIDEGDVIAVMKR